MKESVYEVVWPLGKFTYQRLSFVPRVLDLRSKTVCELSDWLFRTEDVFPVIREELQKRYPGVKFIEYTKFGNIHGPKESEVITALPELLRKHRCDVVISGIGG